MEATVCKACDGEGVVPGEDDSGDSFLDEECPNCAGEGWLDVDDEEE